MYKFIDLFAGIGGMRLAYEAAGCRCVFSSEINDFARKTYAANFGDVPFGDITQAKAGDIPDSDILVGGFPCQPFSIAGIGIRRRMGKKSGLADETQGTLFFEICRLLDACRPRAFMLENVKNLLSHDRGRTFRIIREALDALDYAVFHAVLDGAGFVPQHRERVIIVGFDRTRYGNDVSFAFDLPPREARPNPKLKDILEPDPDPKYTISDRLFSGLKRHKKMQSERGHGFGYSIADLDGISHTLSARYGKDGSEILIPQKGSNPRKLTPRECARLQGFPEAFLIPVSDTQAYRQFGNSVVVPLMHEVAKLVTAKLKELDAAELTGGQAS